jgi:hypothetical protein
MKNYNGWHVASIPSPGPALVSSDGSRARYMGWTPCIEWCEQQFGSRRYYLHTAQGAERWRFISEGVFEFECEEDRLLFLLRWGQ